MAKKVTVHVVRRIDWDYNDEFNYRLDDESGAASIRSFLTREKAEAHRRELERSERDDRNPFDYGGDGSDLADYSTLSAEEFRARMEDAGLQVVAPRTRLGLSFRDWFDRLRRLSVEQRHAIWDALDLVRFFEVVPLEVELEE